MAHGDLLKEIVVSFLYGLRFCCLQNTKVRGIVLSFEGVGRG